MRSTRSAMSSCRHSRRRAEQRWPAEPNALVSTSVTTCSANAELSTIIALMPPVSAMNGTIGPDRAASDRAISRAVSVPPVKATPAMRSSCTRAWPTVPSPGSSASTVCGTPAWSSSATARAAASGVCSAGFAATALPAASAAATWPVKIASGKFHGEMAANTPRPPSAQVFRSPVGPGSSRGSAKSRRAWSAYQRQ